MNKLSPQKKNHLILVALGAAAVIAGLWFVVISAQNRALALAVKDAREMADKAEKAEALLARADEIAETLETKSERLSDIEETMGSGDLYLWIINTVNQFIGSRDVSIPAIGRESIRDAQMLPKFPYKTAVFTVRGSAHYHALGSFVADFENAFPHFAIQNLRMTPMASLSREDREKIEFEFDIVTLIKPAS